jgi:glycerol-1-phosphate dehydrogenase [NAD(P)+]
MTPPTEALRLRARAPELRFVAGGAERAIRALGGRVALITQPEPLAELGAATVGSLAAVRTVASLAVEALDALDSGLPEVETVVGLGGGMAMDAAKYVAWRRGLPLVLLPSIVSVDACVTNTIAVRTGGGVEYRGFVVADAIVVDTDLVKRAPPRLNRAGVGDLLSIHTALWDWRAGDRAGRATWRPEIAERSAAALDRVDELADEIGAVTARAVEAIVRGYAEVNALCLDAGHSLPEEGSEHYLGYLLETLTGCSFVHGELIGLGTVTMAVAQANDPGRPVRVLDRCRVAWRPAELGIEPGLLERAMGELPAFVREQRLPWSIADETDLAGRAGAIVTTVLDLAAAGARP